MATETSNLHIYQKV